MQSPSNVDWKKEIELTLSETGFTKAELGVQLGLYVQHQPLKNGNVKSTCGQIYAWISGKNKPPYYLLLALRHLRAQAAAKNGAGAARVSKTKPRL